MLVMCACSDEVVVAPAQSEGLPCKWLVGGTEVRRLKTRLAYGKPPNHPLSNVTAKPK